MRLYVAGPMTGLLGHNHPAFHAAADDLRAAGYDVINPARRLPVDGKPWTAYMRDALRDLLDADAVALLPGWHASRGATLERVVARALGMPCQGIDAWLMEEAAG